MQIKNPFLKDEPYFTKIEYANGEYYEGEILNSMYHGQGVYGNR